jgi:hypothetical protein
MADQSLLSERQDQLVFALSTRWTALQDTDGENADSVLAAAAAGLTTLQEGGRPGGVLLGILGHWKCRTLPRLARSDRRGCRSTRRGIGTRARPHRPGR